MTHTVWKIQYADPFDSSMQSKIRISSALTGFKTLKNSLFPAIQNVTRVTNSAVFSINSAVFSEEYCMENIALLFH